MRFAWTLGKARASVSAETELVPHSVPAHSGFSKRIPRLESPEGGTAHYQRSQGEVYRVRVHITPHAVLREMGALDQGHI